MWWVSCRRSIELDSKGKVHLSWAKMETPACQLSTKDARGSLKEKEKESRKERGTKGKQKDRRTNSCYVLSDWFERKRENEREPENTKGRSFLLHLLPLTQSVNLTQTHHEINILGSKSLTCLIKLIDTTRTQLTCTYNW